MPFNLTENELQLAYEAIEHHGYSVLVPAPPEWQAAKDHWDDYRQILAGLDLDTYRPKAPMRVYAPKSRFTLRAVTLLHPDDLLIYTALTLIAKDDIEQARDPTRKQRVFSFRSDPMLANRLYSSHGLHEEYRQRLLAKSKTRRNRFVAVTDIADFYPRIYQHRLERMLSRLSQVLQG
jgi:hypothetical protein